MDIQDYIMLAKRLKAIESSIDTLTVITVALAVIYMWRHW